MSRCIIHMGMHKTGSTSIQASLQGFEDARFVYADYGSDANHSLPIYSLFAGQPDRHHLHDGLSSDAVRAYIDQTWADMRRSVSKTEQRTMLISGEDIGSLPQNSLAKLHRYLKPHFHEIIVVGYVRPPAAYITSHFQQRVKGGAIGRFRAERMYRNYRATFEKFDEVFGRDRVRLWKFDPGTFPGGCVVQDFCFRLDILLPEERIIRLNESLSREAVGLLYTYIKIAKKRGWPAIRGLEATKLMARMGTGRFRFSPDVIRSVLNENRADIEWMEVRLGQSLHEDLGELQPGDVREERDLLRPDAGVVNTLLDLLGDAAPKGVKGKTPKEVALLVHALRDANVAAANRSTSPAQRPIPTRRRKGPGHPAELPKETRSAGPKLLNAIPHQDSQAQVASVVRKMYATLRRWKRGT